MKHIKLSLILALFAVIVTSCSSDDDVIFGPKEYVDLGLPSGTLWATCNIGATEPEDMGQLFAWGEVVPKKIGPIEGEEEGGHIVDADGYYVDLKESYKWWNEGFTKYSGMYYNSMMADDCQDYVAILESCDDAATVNWGKDWKTPTPEQWKELISNCVVYAYGNSICYRAKNGNTIEFPVYWKYNPCTSGMNQTSYWTNELDSSTKDCVIIYTQDFSKMKIARDHRWNTCLIRPVRNK